MKKLTAEDVANLQLSDDEAILVFVAGGKLTDATALTLILERKR